MREAQLARPLGIGKRSGDGDTVHMEDSLGMLIYTALAKAERCYSPDIHNPEDG